MSGFEDEVVAEAVAILDAFKVERAVDIVATFAGRSVAELDAGEVDLLWLAAGDAFFNLHGLRRYSDG